MSNWASKYAIVFIGAYDNDKKKRIWIWIVFIGAYDYKPKNQQQQLLEDNNKQKKMKMTKLNP